jgi:two-component system chemotaxis response regulator CheY
MMKPSILIVDDNEPLLRLLKSIFDKRYTVFTASDGVEAIHLLTRGIRPRLILCDLQMQNIDGYELVSHLSTSRLYRDIPVILLTDVKRITEVPPTAAVVKIVHKPFDPVFLSDTVNAVLEGHHAPAVPAGALFTSGSFFTTSKS